MIDEEKFIQVYDKLTLAWGKESQMRLCIEEMSELTKELCKFMRYSLNEQSQENDAKLKQIKENIIEETADVLICASQIKRLFGDDEVKKIMNFKIERGDKIVSDYIKKNNKEGK